MTIGTDKLPQGWKWVALGEIILGKPQYGSVARKVPYDGKVRYVRITDLTDRGELKPDDPVSPSVIQPDRFLEPGDLLIARSGSVGRTYLHGNLPGTYQYAGYLIRFRIDPAKSLPAYVFYVSQSDLWREWIVRNSKTSTLTNINAKQYSSFHLPLPPLGEQKRIAGLLKQQMAFVEKARQAAEEMLELAHALPGAFLRQTFPAHGDALPPGWEWTKLGDVCEIVSGSTPKTNVAEYWNGTITWITPTDLGKLTTRYINSSQRAITQTGYDSCSTKLIPAGAVVMSTRAPIGHLGVTTLPLCTNQGCKTFVPGVDVATEFLYFSLLTYMKDIQALGSGSTFQEVSKTKLSQFEICLPPLCEQQRIAALLKEQMAYVQTICVSAREQLDAIHALPAALLRMAFAGNL